MKNVLVTGGAGFIGSHVAKWLVKAGYRVVVLDDLSGGFAENLPQGVEFVKGSVLDVRLVDSLFEKEKFSAVVVLGDRYEILMVALAAVNTFISTVISGGLYTVLLFVVIKSDPSALAAYIPIVLGTATLNAIIVGALYVPLMKALKKPIIEEEKAE